MRKIVILAMLAIFVIATTYAGNINIYLEGDIAPQWSGSGSSGDASYDQTTGFGLGIEYLDILADKVSYAAGGRYQLDRELTAGSITAKYNSHLLYGQVFYNISDKVDVGAELNYSIHGGDNTYKGTATLSGALGYGIVASYKLNNLLLKGGYRIVNLKANYDFEGNIDVDSTGIFLQAGYVI